MKNNSYKAPEFFCVATTFLVSTALNASGIPPINVTLSSGLNTNYVKISKGQLKVVEYKIQDVIGKLPSRTWLWSPTAPAYATRTNSLHQPDCAMYNQPYSNPNSFTLPPHGFCYFSIQIDGTKFANALQATASSYRPVFTNSDGVAYGSCQSEIIYTTLTPILPIISAGTYIDTNGIQRPLLTYSQDLGTSWLFPASTNAPAPNIFQDFGLFSGASCSDNICIAVGKGENVASNNYPLIAVSQNSGDTWRFATSITEPVFSPTESYPYFANGMLNSGLCYKNTSIATGHYKTTITNTQRPLLAFSQDSGSSWNFSDAISQLVFSPTNANPFLKLAELNSVTCNNNICITAGSYTDTSNIKRPMAALSQDAGNTWIYPSLFNDPVFIPTSAAHPFQNNSYFFKTSCGENTCIIVGMYNDTTNTIRPLLALSQDSGNTWVFPAALTNPVFATNVFNTGFFQSANCYKNTCIAVGNYTDTNGITRPLLGLSKDSGNTWNFPESLTAPIFMPDNSINTFSDNGHFNSVSCYGTTCIAAGNYLDNNFLTRPLLAVSQDLGSTWTFPSSTNTPVFTPSNTNDFFDRGSFADTSCNATTCIASGRYMDNNGIDRPLLAMSQDFGNTWTYPSSTNEPVFSPQNNNPFQSDGRFSGASASASAPFLPDSLKILHRRSLDPNNQRHIGKSPH